ncbi:MAG: DUF1853 family protein [Halieaceae bacterium]|nr:DUF1853 family protein [Halieaceae bacterium]
MPGRFYRDPYVRDLAWAGFSPLLMRGPGLAGAGLEFNTFWRDHLAQLDAKPDTLREFLGDTPSGRLGLYYERLWHYLLLQDPDTKLLAHNLPVQDGRRTVGEFDCLYWCRRRESHVHLELAVKFYLGVPGTDVWLGPGQHDRLDQKLHHLTSHQSRLAMHPAAKTALRKLGIEECQGVVDIKGYLFAPENGMPAPEYHHAANELRHWHTLTEFSELHADGDMDWQEIPRRRWLAPYASEDGPVRSSDELMEMLESQLQGDGRPVQLAACDDHGREQTRCFVTPDDWPSRFASQESSQT